MQFDLVYFSLLKLNNTGIYNVFSFFTELHVLLYINVAI